MFCLPILFHFCWSSEREKIKVLKTFSHRILMIYIEKNILHHHSNLPKSTSLSKPVSRILLIAKLISDKDEFLTDIPMASSRDCLEVFLIKKAQLGGSKT